MKFSSYVLPLFASLLVAAAPLDNCLTPDVANAVIARFFQVYEGGDGLNHINDFVNDDISVIYPEGNHNKIDPIASGKDQFTKLVSSITDGTQNRFVNPKLTNLFSFFDCQNVGVYVRSDFTLTDVGANSHSDNTANTVGAPNSAQFFHGMHMLSVDCKTGLVHTIRSFDDQIHFLGVQGIDPISVF